MNLRNSLFFSALLIALLWFIWLLDVLIPIDFARFGIVPRSREGLIGLGLAPLIHGGREHLAANTGPLFVLSVLKLYFYKRLAWLALPFVYVLSGLLVWLFGREAFHIGASGLIYGLAAFLVVSGLYRKQFLPLLIAVAVLILYGGMIWGVLPHHTGVSWESHLAGGVAGSAGAYFLRNRER